MKNMLDIKDRARLGGGGAEPQLAFTLAEVLITLAIIGVVAAITMPSLISNRQEKANVIKLKKAYSNLSNAYNLSLMEKGSLLDYIQENDDKPNWYSYKSHKAFRDYFADNMKVLQYGISWTQGVVFYENFNKSETYSLQDGNSFASFTTADGTLYVFRYLNTDIGAFVDEKKNKIGVIFVVLDHKRDRRKVYQSGKNVFIFSIYKNNNKILPGGYSTVDQDTLTCYTNLYACT